MVSVYEASVPDPSLFSAAWRYRWLVLAFGIGFALIASAAVVLAPDRYTASAILVVEDPKASQLFDTGGFQSPDRYVQDQVSILQSTAVATRAAEIAQSSGASVDIDAKSIIERAQIASSRSSNVIDVRFTGSNPREPIVISNALAEAYQEVRRNEALANFARALEELDATISVLDDELLAIEERIEESSFSDPARAALFEQYESALTRLAELQSVVADENAEDRETARAGLDDLFLQLQTLQLIIGLDSQRPELVTLLNQQEEATARRSTLAARRAELEVDAELASGVALYFPSTVAESADLPLAIAVMAGFVAGALVGVGIAYLLARRRQAVDSPSLPESVLSAPLLAEIPDFDDEGLRSPLPVFSAPRSVAAEAFRFAAGAIELHLSGGGPLMTPGNTTPGIFDTGSPGRPSTIAVVSADEGDGKSIVVANAALASCWTGNRVLVIDADFGAQSQTQLFLRGESPRYGLADVILREVGLAHATQTIDLSFDLRFDLLTRGQVPVSATDLLRSEEALEFFGAIADDYDLVFVDTPPLSRVAYSSILARHADRVLVVVPHGSPTAALEAVRHRLELVGTPIAGYVYNRAPLDVERTSYGGSLEDVVDTSGDDSGDATGKHRQ